MKLKPTRCTRLRARLRHGGFTLAEVLAALVFMAIVIPVAVQGLRVASAAGQLGQRKAVASRIADRVLNELVATGQYQTSAPRGTIRDGQLEYQWSTRLEPWNQGVLRLLVVYVTFPLQGAEHQVRLTTIVDTSL